MHSNWTQVVPNTKGNGNILQMCDEMYGVVENISSIIIRNLCNY
jgi:hypothetical protein